MAKKIVKKIKIIASGGAATLTPAMGQVLGPAGINIGEFVKKFNEASKEMRGEMKTFAAGHEINAINGADKVIKLRQILAGK